MSLACSALRFTTADLLQDLFFRDIIFYPFLVIDLSP
jgi:hypothetical protein